MDTKNDDAHVNGGAAAPPTPQPDKTVDPSAALAGAVKGSLEDAAKQAAAVQQMREAQAKALYAQKREALAGIILNGMCSGVYPEILSGEVQPGFGDRLVTDAVQFADRLMIELAKPPGAANG